MYDCISAAEEFDLHYSIMTSGRREKSVAIEISELDLWFPIESLYHYRMLYRSRPEVCNLSSVFKP
jgi:hypothetical protein